MNWAQTFLQYKPLSGGAGTEPALTSANIILATILGPPFTWRWNRKYSSTFTLNTPNQDVSVAISDFGFLEKASILLPAGSPPPSTIEPEIKTILGAATEQGRPQYIAAQLDDNAGNITFRVLPAADANYTGLAVYQKKPPLMTTTGSSWAPIPDEYSYIYNMGFMALMMFYDDDPRAQIFNQKFVSALLGASEGLSETQKNMFMGTWLTFTSNAQASSLRTQQGFAARSV